MPNLQSAIKRNRQNKKRREHNRHFRGRANTLVRKARVALESGDLEEARQVTKRAVSALDKAASKGVIHQNNASRRKGRLMQQLAALEK